MVTLKVYLSWEVAMTKITDNVYHIGIDDYITDLFEGQYKIPNGISYNSYVISDSKVAVLDTVDEKFSEVWLDEIKNILSGKSPDYLIIQHMEPDHSASIDMFMNVYPDVCVVANEKTFEMIEAFFPDLSVVNKCEVSEGDTLSLGEHTLNFVFAPMVHWPEVMVTYESKNKILFSADGFGRFGTVGYSGEWADEARRYYFGIVGKYGPQVQSLLKKAETLDIKHICPLHGNVLSGNLEYYLNLYDMWSSYDAESDGVVIAYTSVYGNTKEAVLKLESMLKERGCPKVVTFDLCRDDLSVAVENAFRYSKLILATTTYNSDIFPQMYYFIHALIERNFQNRSVGIIENGSWAPRAGSIMRTMLDKSKNLYWYDTAVKIKSALSQENINEIDNLSKEVCFEYMALNTNDNNLNPEALFKIGYGLYVVTCANNLCDNGTIVNAVTQVTNTPDRVAVAINKGSYSHDIIKDTGIMNVNCLAENAPFSLFKRFGFASGRDTDKFDGVSFERTSNGLAVLAGYVNAVISLKTEQYIDLDTHGMFICSVTESKVLSQMPTMTYTHYLSDVRPKPDAENKKGFVCKICGYVYEGEELPPDYICPLCKHGASDFEKIN